MICIQFKFSGVWFQSPCLVPLVSMPSGKAISEGKWVKSRVGTALARQHLERLNLKPGHAQVGLVDLS